MSKRRPMTVAEERLVELAIQLDNSMSWEKRVKLNSAVLKAVDAVVRERSKR